jgi:hypothetical protein
VPIPTGAPVISAATLVSTALINGLVARSVFSSTGAARHRDIICQRGRRNLSRGVLLRPAWRDFARFNKTKIETAFHRSEALTTITANPPPPTIPPATLEIRSTEAAIGASVPGSPIRALSSSHRTATCRARCSGWTSGLPRGRSEALLSRAKNALAASISDKPAAGD